VGSNPITRSSSQKTKVPILPSLNRLAISVLDEELLSLDKAKLAWRVRNQSNRGRQLPKPVQLQKARI
jgi:hypothetical protein